MHLRRKTRSLFELRRYFTHIGCSKNRNSVTSARVVINLIPSKCILCISFSIFYICNLDIIIHWWKRKRESIQNFRYILSISKRRSIYIFRERDMCWRWWKQHTRKKYKKSSHKMYIKIYFFVFFDDPEGFSDIGLFCNNESISETPVFFCSCNWASWFCISI